MATDDTAHCEAEDDEAGTRGSLLKYRGKDNRTGALGGGQPFLLYWCKEAFGISRSVKDGPSGAST
ncbi:hypothetical protein [Saccharopolyspora hattusasensis]|uniref:hypothetical protein n=1 Tax=Saccharopolyspora hattusasensis TaxID=1128679 RepID=UPI003D95B0E1